MEEQDVRKQLERMRKFILDEAQNKRLEILQSAEEEANREKDRLIRQGEMAIIKDLERKAKQVEVAKKIRASNEINQSRLQVLRAREEAVNTVCSHAHQGLFKLSENPEKNRKLLKDLTLQAVEIIDESDVSLVCRASDKNILQGLLPEVIRDYKAKTGKDVKLTIDTKFLDPSSAGGIVAVAGGGAVIVSNTLEQRLQLAVEGLLPQIRSTLFS